MSAKIRLGSLVSLVFIIIALAAIGYPVLTEKGFPLDDSWIHQVVGRNLFLYGIPSFIPGQYGSGSTSAIWPFIVAINYQLLPNVGHETFLFFFNAFMFSGVILTLFAAAALDRLTPLEMCVVACASLTGNFAWLVASGMEHVLFVVSAFGAAVLWIIDTPRFRFASAGLSGFLLGIAILARPEGIAFVPLFVAVLPWVRKRAWEIALFLSVIGAAMGLMLLYVHWTSGSLLPVTYSGRRWMYFPNNKLSGTQHIILSVNFLKSWIVQIRDYFFVGALSPLDNGKMVIGVLILIEVGLYRLIKQRAFTMLFLVSLAIVNICVYLIALPTYGQGGRYQAAIMPLVYPLFGLGALSVSDWAIGFRTRPTVTRIGRTIVFVLTLLVAFSSLAQWSQITRLGIRHINDTHVKMGKWIRANLPSSENIAAFDIGGIAFFADHPIVDLSGLTDPAVLPYLFDQRVNDYLIERKIKWVVLPISANDEIFADFLGLTESKGISKQEIIEFGSPLETWLKGWNGTGHSFPRQALYSIRPVGDTESR